MAKKLEFKVNESRIEDFVKLGKLLGVMQFLEKADIIDPTIEGAYIAYQEIRPYLETTKSSDSVNKAVKEIERIYRKHKKAYERRSSRKKNE